MTPLQRKWLEHLAISPDGIVDVDARGPQVLGPAWGNVNRSCVWHGWITLVEITPDPVQHRRMTVTEQGYAALEGLTR